MRLVAALLVGVVCALLAAALLGTMPRRRSRPGAVSRLTTRRLRADVWLHQADVGVGLVRFVFGSAAAGLLALLVVSTLTGSVFVAAVPGVAVALVPRAYFGRRRRFRLREVQAAWPDGLRDLVASIAAGHSLTQAVTNLSVTGPPTMRVAFRRASRSWRGCSGPVLHCS